MEMNSSCILTVMQICVIINVIDLSWRLGMVHKYQKDYFEEYARLLLEDYLSVQLVNHDMPDLLCVVDGFDEVGIEVVRDISDHEGHCDTVWLREYEGENIYEQMKEAQNKIDNFIGDIVEKEGVIAWNHGCLVNKIEEAQYTINCIKDKCNKMKTYAKCNNNYLFIFSNHIWSRMNLDNVIRRIDFVIPYDKLLILASSVLFEYDTKSKTVKEQVITNEDSKHYIELAMKYQESKLINRK